MILNHVIEGAGRPVVRLHPVGIDLSFLAPLAALLAQGYRVMDCSRPMIVLPSCRLKWRVAAPKPAFFPQ